MKKSSNPKRQELLTRGFYVVMGVEIAFLGLSANAYTVLILLTHYQGDDPYSYALQEEMAKRTGLSVRTVQNALKELRDKGALVRIRTSQGNRYSLNYALMSRDEVEACWDITAAEDTTNTQESCESPETDTQDSFVSDTQESCGSFLYKKEPPKKNHSFTDADASEETEAEVIQMPFNCQLPEDDLDPATGLGLWRSQESPDGPSDGLESVLPGMESYAPPTGRQERVQSQARLDSPGGLVSEFRRLIKGTPLNDGPSPINQGAMLRMFKDWKAQGMTADQIRQIMRLFVEDTSLHNPQYATWNQLRFHSRDLWARVTGQNVAPMRRGRQSAQEREKAAAAHLEAVRYDSSYQGFGKQLTEEERNRMYAEFLAENPSWGTEGGAA